MASATLGAGTPFASPTPIALQDVQITSPVDSRDQPRSRQRKMPIPDLQMVGAVHTLGTADNAVVTRHGSLNETIEWIKSNADNSKLEWSLRNQLTRHKIEVQGEVNAASDGLQQRIRQLESEVAKVISELATLRSDSTIVSPLRQGHMIWS